MIYYKELLAISFPILSSLATTLINIATVPILGNYGVDDMAAAAVAASIVMIITNVFLASYTGFRILGSKAYGADNSIELNRYMSASLTLGLMVAFLLLISIFLFGHHVTTLMSNEKKIQELSFAILKINILSLPINAVMSFILIDFGLRKKTKISLYVTLIANTIGIFISIILVYGYRTIPSYGAIGAAWASFFENVLACIICIALFYLTPRSISIKFILNINNIKKLWDLSYPMMLSMFIDYLGNFIMFVLIGHYMGKEAIAGGRLGFSLLLLAFTIITSLSSGFMILGGRALGEKSDVKFREYYKANKNILLVLAFFLSVFMLLVASCLLNFFTAFIEIRDITFTPIMIVASICPFMALSYNNACCLRLLEKVKQDMKCNAFSLWIIQLPLSYYLGVYSGWGLNGFFLALLAYETVYVLSTYYLIPKNVLL